MGQLILYAQNGKVIYTNEYWCRVYVVSHDRINLQVSVVKAKI